MKRMIETKFIDYVNSLFDNIIDGGTYLSIQKGVDVEGDLHADAISSDDFYGSSSGATIIQYDAGTEKDWLRNVSVNLAEVSIEDPNAYKVFDIDGSERALLQNCILNTILFERGHIIHDILVSSNVALGALGGEVNLIPMGYNGLILNGWVDIPNVTAVTLTITLPQSLYEAGFAPSRCMAMSNLSTPTLLTQALVQGGTGHEKEWSFSFASDGARIAHFEVIFSNVTAGAVIDISQP